jgi:hypothetical protein
MISSPLLYILSYLGHTVGLLHSHSANNNDPYGDRIGYMGSGYTNPIWPRKCFNAYNLFMFQWYSDRHYNIIDVLFTGNHIVHLTSFPDYNITRSDQPVIINIENTYYLNYNRAKKFNIDTEHKKDQVSIIQPVDSGTNSLIGLTPGSNITYEVTNYKNSGKKLVIEACMVVNNYDSNNNNDIADVVIVSIAIDHSECSSIRQEIMERQQQQQQQAVVISKRPLPQDDTRNESNIVNMLETLRSPDRSIPMSNDSNRRIYPSSTPSIRPSTNHPTVHPKRDVNQGTTGSKEHLFSKLMQILSRKQD